MGCRIIGFLIGFVVDIVVVGMLLTISVIHFSDYCCFDDLRFRADCTAQVFVFLLFYTLVDMAFAVRYYSVDMLGGAAVAGCVWLYNSISAPQFYWVGSGIFCCRHDVCGVLSPCAFLWQYGHSACPGLCALCAHVRWAISFWSLVASTCCLHSVQTHCRSFLY